MGGFLLDHCMSLLPVLLFVAYLVIFRVHRFERLTTGCPKSDKSGSNLILSHHVCERVMLSFFPFFTPLIADLSFRMQDLKNAYLRFESLPLRRCFCKDK